MVTIRLNPTLTIQLVNATLQNLKQHRVMMTLMLMSDCKLNIGGARDDMPGVEVETIGMIATTWIPIAHRTRSRKN